MITCDLARMGLAAHHGRAPESRSGVLVALLFAITMISSPFTAARAATYPEILSGDLYVTGTAITLTNVPAGPGHRVRGRRRHNDGPVAGPALVPARSTPAPSPPRRC